MRSSGKKIIAFLVGSFYLLGASFPKPLISTQDHLDISNFYSTQARETIVRELAILGYRNAELSVDVLLEFKLEQLELDAKTWYESRQQDQNKAIDEALQKTKDNFRDLLKEALDEQKRRDDIEKKEKEAARAAELMAEKAAKANEPTKNAQPQSVADNLGGVNFGGSNKVMDIESINIPVEGSTGVVNHRISIEKASAPVSVGVNFPGPRETIEPFKFKAADYLKKVSILITTAADIPENINQKIIDRVETGLNLKLISNGNPTTDWIKVSKAPAVPEKRPTISSFFSTLWSPENIFVSILALSLVLGFCLLGSAFLISFIVRNGLQKAASELNQGLATLKPRAEGEEEKNVTAQAEVVQDNPEKNVDKNASSQAITRELGSIRSQFAVLIQKETFSCAEIIKDLIYSPTGYSDFLDLLVFSGHSALQPVMDLLPQTTIQKILLYIEDNKSDQKDLVNGARIAQSIYGEVIARLSFRSEEGKVLVAIKEILISMEDETVGAFLQNATAIDISILLRSMSNDRSSRMLTFIPTENMKSAMQMLASDFSDAKTIVPEVAARLKKMSVGIMSQNQAQSRLLLKLVKMVAIEDEDQVYDLIPAADWELKKKIFKIRVLFRDIIYVPKTVIDQSFGSLPSKVKAQILVSVEGAVKDVLLANLPAGSRKRELIDQEISDIESSEKKKNQALNNRWNLLGTLMNNIRINLLKDEKLLTEMISNQAAAFNIPDPNDKISKLNAA